jgi:PAS domain S-box-containing protein
MQEIAFDRFRGSAFGKIDSRLGLLRPALAALALVLGYYVGAKVGFALTFAPHPVSTLWPPNSILLAALVLAPYRWWLLLLLAVLPAHFLIQLQSGVPVPMIVCWFVSNSSEALIGAFCLRYLTDSPLRFDSIRQVTILVFVALFAPFVSSFLDASFVILNRFGTGSYWEVWRMRFFANVLAEIILVPLIVLWASEPLATFRLWSVWRWLETVALVAAVSAVSVVAFSLNLASNTPALMYAPVPILLWAAIRFGPKGMNLCLVLVTLFTIWNAVHGYGPFIANSPEENALAIQLFLILISMPLMFLSAVIQELGRAQEKAQQNEDRLTLTLSAAQMGIWDWHITGGVTKWANETKKMFGLSPSDHETTPEGFLALLHPDDRAPVEQAINRSIMEGVPYESEFRVPHRDGSIHWIRGKGKVVFDEQGKPLRMIGINHDITGQKNSEVQLRESHRQIRALAGRLINAQETERRRISRELHDDLNQRVATLALALSRLKRKLIGQPEIMADLNALYDQTNYLSDDIRQLSHELHPVTLEHLGLTGALKGYIAEFEGETGIAMSFSAQIKRKKIPFEISVCLYRIALEALRNIAKHSHAKSASVVLEEDNQVLKMSVVDSGVGFEAETVRRGSGLGLVSAEERVNLLQGTFDVESTPAKGTKLTAKIPLR